MGWYLRSACLVSISVVVTSSHADLAADLDAIDKGLAKYVAELKLQTPTAAGERSRIADALQLAEELGKSVKARLSECGAANGAPATKERCVQKAATLKSMVQKLEVPKPGDSDRATVSLVASESQDKVDKLRLKYKTAYERGDAATATAIALPDLEQLGSGAARQNVAELARRWANEGRDNPRLMKNAISIAQNEADRLIAAALALRDCGPRDQNCAASFVADGLVAKALFEDQVGRAEQLDKDLSEAALGLAELKAKPDRTPADLANAVAFRKLLENNPDVMSFFGGDAVGFSAGSNDSTVSFRYVADLDGSLINRRNRFSFIFSAPTNKDGPTRFVDSADALKNLASVKVGWQLTNAPFKLLGTGTLNDFALGLTAGQDTRSFFVVNDASPNEATETKKNYVVVSLGGRWALLTNPTSAYKTLFVFGFDAQRRYKNGDVETRCPTDPAATTPGLASCFTGSWGEPSRLYSRLLGFELRQHMPAFDIGLKLKQDLATHKLDAEIPIYLIRDIADEAKKMPFTAGISLSRTKGDPGPRWGLFVSAPLSFGKPER